ncbi:cellulose binding domain-containing protein [Streptosporangium subroseum]|uniref:cellulose binding domain-containing protein n=1 Tax=Streptosporangium subroseum TaxID=106412 RepID=UPI003090F099|nr:cellulose-binding domain-containing protein [Streptosporangium subroseum]
MPSGKKIAPLLGLVSLGAAVALIAVACVGQGPQVRHGGTHPAALATHPAHPAGSTLPTASPTVSAPPVASALPASSAPPVATAHSTASSAASGSGSRCRATVTLVESWPGGYRGSATISNATGRPMQGWYIQWVQPMEATFTQSWNGTHMQSGPIAMIHAPAEKAVLPAGATVSDIGFVGAAAAPPTFTEITCG